MFIADVSAAITNSTLTPKLMELVSVVRECALDYDFRST